MENPFDHPPTTPRIDVDPVPSGVAGAGRGRMALVALASAGLLGAGIFGVSYLVSADDPELEVPRAAATPDETPDEPVPGDAGDEDDEDDGGEEDSDDVGEPGATVSGQIVIDDGDGDPIVIDLDDLDLGELGAGVPGLSECFDVIVGDLEGELGGEFDFDLDEMFEEFDLDELFGDLPIEEWEDGAWGSSVTVTGPDGTTIIDLGDGASVTVTNEGGELRVETEGDASLTDLDDLFGEFDLDGMFEEFPLDEMFGEHPPFGDFGMFEPGDLEDCISVEVGE